MGRQKGVNCRSLAVTAGPPKTWRRTHPRRGSIPPQLHEKSDLPGQTHGMDEGIAPPSNTHVDHAKLGRIAALTRRFTILISPLRLEC